MQLDVAARVSAHVNGKEARSRINNKQQVEIHWRTQSRYREEKGNKFHSVGLQLVVNYDYLQIPDHFIGECICLGSSFCVHRISSQKSFQENLESTNLERLATTPKPSPLTDCARTHSECNVEVLLLVGN